MKTVVKNRKLIDLENLIGAYSEVKHAKVMYMLARELTIIRPLLEDVRTVTKPTEIMIKFDKARIELVKKFAEKDEKGRPKQEMDPMTRRARFVVKDLAELDEAVEELAKKEYPQALIDREEAEKRGEEILDEEVEVDFYGIRLNKIPGFRHEGDEENGIFKAKDMALLMELGIILEPEEEPRIEQAGEENKETAKAKLTSV